MKITLNIDLVNRAKEDLAKEIYPLKKHIYKRRLFLPELKNKGGIYAFWWNGKVEELKNALLTCDYKLKGKQSQKELITVRFTSEWIDFLDSNGNVCLYVGKSTDIKSRISKHLKLGTDDIWTKPNGEIIDKNIGIKPNTESQLRTGLERIFNRSMIDEIIDNIGVSWIILDEYKNGINRFYLEDYFIGKYFPLFNIDIER